MWLQATVNRFWILNLGFWIDPYHKGKGYDDFKFGILDLFRPLPSQRDEVRGGACSFSAGVPK
ncbi:hypothetical protein Cal7507_0389 [Calothrix sp. PCC 7507]|nr:hypothetical protein Cal7507_0389 [Calothrix sp. PCC 7507]